MNRRGKIVWAMAVAAALVVVPSFVPWPPRLLWNASASVPIGLYLLRPADQVAVGDLVAVQPPSELSDFLDERGYLPRYVPLLKHVEALPGSIICRAGNTIIVDQSIVGFAHFLDSLGRRLPRWEGCRHLTDGEIFLMNPEAPDSLDGRYFGPLPSTAITARLVPLWVHPGTAQSRAMTANFPNHHNSKESFHAPDR
ncbi:S26 family signal peptidase [Roseibium sp.]|uniref:S26 family signal peptidase n=1 Tax=Roseibium sp. TaxID=1936156 RepID=UPI003298C79B